MRGIKLSILWIFLFTLINSDFLFCMQEEEWDKDNYGKVIGWIFDPETNKRVNEKFAIAFFYVFSEDPKRPECFITSTDSRGYFTINLKPGKYYIQITPNSDDSKFCYEPIPYRIAEGSPTFNVKKGQITEIIKKATVGGNLKVTLVDPNGQKINVQEIFKDKNFSITVYNEKSGEGFSIDRADKTSGDDAESTFYNFFPGKHSVEFSGGTVGCGNKKVHNILIEKNKTTYYDFVIDIFTGIEGIVKNELSVPISSVWVGIRSIDNPDLIAMVFSDANGNFKIIGLTEGWFNLGAIIEINGKTYVTEDIKVYIKTNEIQKKDIVLKTNQVP